MGWFAQLFGKKINKPKQSLKEIYLQFAQIISDNDDAVLDKVRSLFEQTPTFLATHQHYYDERGINPEQISQEALYWIGFADILITHHYAAEFDWKAELADFEYFLQNLQGFQSFPMIDFPVLDASGAVHLWIEQINTHWQNQPLVLMQQDIDSDSHIVFPIKKEHMAFLKTTSQQIGQKFAETI